MALRTICVAPSWFAEIATDCSRKSCSMRNSKRLDFRKQDRCKKCDCCRHTLSNASRGHGAPEFPGSEVEEAILKASAPAPTVGSDRVHYGTLLLPDTPRTQARARGCLLWTCVLFVEGCKFLLRTTENFCVWNLLTTNARS